MRRPNIRRVRDWNPSASLRPAPVPLDLLPPPRFVGLPCLADPEDDDDDKSTIALAVPTNSEVRTLQTSMSDPDSALDSLVAVYEERVTQRASEPVPEPAETARETPKSKARSAPIRRREDGTRAKLQPHVWKIVYSTICVWGLVQLALTR